MYMYRQKLLCITSDEMNGIVESCSQTTIKCDGSLGMRLGIVGVSESEQVVYRKVICSTYLHLFQIMLV